jgi:hypothetical protein
MVILTCICKGFHAVEPEIFGGRSSRFAGVKASI